MATVHSRQINVHLPSPSDGEALDQDEEWCEVDIGGERRRIRFHDYASIYEVPGLYERLFSDLLECCSPDVVCQLLSEELDQVGTDPRTLTALDFGAGNGMVGERLSQIGVGTIVGIDLLPEARAAAMRDRPAVYDDYRVLDLTALSATDRAELEGRGFDCLVCVAALGFDDVPAMAFAEAFNLVASSGWLAFNVRGRFLDDDDPAGFGALLERMLAGGVVEQRARTCYTHRISVSGDPLDYVAIVATKQRDVPLSWVR
ncbi:MAG TPA: methyltransferase domain-containing protein [Solirubrobacteraceae bacterium]|jgi:SAM-dependent methyltransferase